MGKNKKNEINIKKVLKKFCRMKINCIFDESNKKMLSKMNQIKMTIREIRRVLFETEKYTVIGADEMTNKESRDFLYNKENQDEILNVIDNGSHLLIFKPLKFTKC